VPESRIGNLFIDVKEGGVFVEFEAIRPCFFGLSSVQGVSLFVKSRVASWRGRYLLVGATTWTERKGWLRFCPSCMHSGWVLFHGTKTTFAVDKAGFLLWGRKGYICVVF
jgi:hypothetical protein